MNWGAIIKALPALLGLIGSLFANRKQPPKRAEDILGGPEEPTDAEKAKAEADRKADEKFSSES